MADFNAERKEKMTSGNRRFIIRDWSAALELPTHCTLQCSRRTRILLYKVCASSAPKWLKKDHKNQRSETPLSHLKGRTRRKGDPAIHSDNESWVQNFTPETKQAGMQLKHPTSPTARV